MRVPSCDIAALPSPCFVVEQAALEQNLAILAEVNKATGARILLALKGFALCATFPTLKKVLAGTCASSRDEARLGREEFGGEVHTFSPAYTEETLSEILDLSDHVLFNSIAQWQKFQPLCQQYASSVEFGLRLNPEHSETTTPLYDPCRPGSRLGMCKKDLQNVSLEGLSGVHFHTLCEQDSYALERTLEAVEANFASALSEAQWVNFGGGHHITRPDYNVAHLIEMIQRFTDRYKVQVYLEPGEAVALNAGFFVATVLDIVKNGQQIAILDASASTHLPDVLEMPYRPEIIGAGNPHEKICTYQLAGVSCLAGDIIGEYSFDHPLQVGERLVFTDMAHYTMVKTTTFNGVRLPSIALCDRGSISMVRTFGYEDFKNRLM